MLFVLLLQFVNLALFVLQIYYHFMTNIWMVFAVILFEGLLGGAAYVNSFYQISKKVTRFLSLLLLAVCKNDKNQTSDPIYLSSVLQVEFLK